MPRHSELGQTSGLGVEEGGENGAGGGGGHLPGHRRRMRLNGDLRLLEMTEDNRRYAEVRM